MTMTVSALIDRHAINKCRKVSTMVKVEPSKKVLVCLARTRMLSGNHARNDFNEVAHARHRPHGEICVSNKTFGCRQGVADEVPLTPQY